MHDITKKYLKNSISTKHICPLIANDLEMSRVCFADFLRGSTGAQPDTSSPTPTILNMGKTGLYLQHTFFTKCTFPPFTDTASRENLIFADLLQASLIF